MFSAGDGVSGSASGILGATVARGADIPEEAGVTEGLQHDISAELNYEKSFGDLKLVVGGGFNSSKGPVSYANGVSALFSADSLDPSTLLAVSSNFFGSLDYAVSKTAAAAASGTTAAIAESSWHVRGKAGDIPNGFASGFGASAGGAYERKDWFTGVSLDLTVGTKVTQLLPVDFTLASGGAVFAAVLGTGFVPWTAGDDSLSVKPKLTAGRAFGTEESPVASRVKLDIPVALSVKGLGLHTGKVTPSFVFDFVDQGDDSSKMGVNVDYAWEKIGAADPATEDGITARLGFTYLKPDKTVTLTGGDAEIIGGVTKTQVGSKGDITFSAEVVYGWVATQLEVGAKFLHSSTAGYGDSSASTEQIFVTASKGF